MYSHTAPNIELANRPAPPAEASAAELCADALAGLEGVFHTAFSLIDVRTGELVLRAADAPGGDWLARGALCRVVAQRGVGEIIEQHDAFCVLALPIVSTKAPRYVAVAGFITHELELESDASRLAEAMLVDPPRAASWAAGRQAWPADLLLQMADLLVQRDVATARAAELERQLHEISDNLSSTYEEISLLHQLTANLKISAGANGPARMALEWLGDVVPAESVVAYLKASGDAHDDNDGPAEMIELLTVGNCSVDRGMFEQLIDELGLGASHRPMVINRGATKHESWRFAGVRQMMLVPLATGTKLFGYLAAFNHREDAEFGTVEASLLNSVATILAIHSGNLELYRDQIDLFTGMLHALVSAIDAKDPCTCGHSDRVARVSKRLAVQMGCSEKMQNTIYLSGLLHDIGKIGIDDEVLRKPGKLTDEEFAHIMLHPELGYKILADIDRLKNVLPGVLHHHEAWDGGGYPLGLAGEQIPLMARIIAVADSFDAMGSDRPYRRGMPEEKVDQILRDGAGQQWDARVVAAFFDARDDIREIAGQEREQIKLDLRQWT